MNTIISIDWITFNFTGFIQDNSFYQFKKQPYGTKQFQQVYKVFNNSIELGTVTSCPYLTSLPKDFCQFKIDNKHLYTIDCVELISLLCSRCSWVYNGISRFDVCIDFNRFLGSLEVESFLSRLAAKKIEPIVKTTLSFKGVSKAGLVYEYLRLGSNSSDVHTILYNKSKEMRDVKEKPWIRKKWDKLGLDHTKDVWRLEFSLHGKAKVFADKATGDIYEIDLPIINDTEQLSKLVSILAYRYFRFIPKTECTNRSRVESIKLLSFDNVKSIRVQDEGEKAIGRADRIFSVQLVRYLNQKNKLEPCVNAEAKLHASDWIWRHNLAAYLHKRGEHIYI